LNSVRLINTTTAFRIDSTLEKGFFSVIDPAFMTALKEHSRQDHIDVQLARRGTPKGGFERIPDTDVLGIYVPHSLPSHYPAIRVFPERVLDACVPWRKAMEKAGCALLFAERYPALLYKVIIHELAHYLMDDRTFADDHCRDGSWTKNVRWLEDNATNQRSDEWANDPVADSERERWVKQKLDARIHGCHVKMETSKDWNNLRLKEQHDLVEESLANAFVLRQQFDPQRQKALEVLMESQSEAYETGLKWHGSLGQLLDIASTWQRFKSDCALFRNRQGVPSSNQQAWLTKLVGALRSPAGVMLPFDFPY
jgi:hypothetical protein